MVLLHIAQGLSLCIVVAEYVNVADGFGPVSVFAVAVAGRPGPVPVLVDVGCGGGSRPDHLAWHTQ
jgi:hypothetical protein